MHSQLLGSGELVFIVVSILFKCAFGEWEAVDHFQIVLRSRLLKDGCCGLCHCLQKVVAFMSLATFYSLECNVLAPQSEWRS